MEGVHGAVRRASQHAVALNIGILASDLKSNLASFTGLDAANARKFTSK